MIFSRNWHSIKSYVFLCGIIMLCAKDKLNAQCHPFDFAALKALYESTDGANWTNRSFWDMVSENETPLPDCNLSFLLGVALNAENRVKSVNLFNNNLTGELPIEIGELSELTTLSFSDNNLSGALPETIGVLSNLTDLSLSNNNLSGALPESIVNLENLKILFLDNNQFSGSIPAGLTNLKQLEWIYAEKNQFSGNLPVRFRNLSKLTYLSLYQNNLQGNIPEDLDSLKNLKWVLLQQNNLSGCYPDNLCSLNADSINLSGNPQLPNSGNFETIDSLCINSTAQIGLTCNDGDENTIDDIIKEDCTCKGEMMISVEEPNSLQTIKIFPNPVVDFFQLQKNNHPIKTIRVVDLKGKIILVANPKGSSSIKVNQLVPGKYLLQIVALDSKLLVIPFVKL